jgi:hypothetical protein
MLVSNRKRFANVEMYLPARGGVYRGRVLSYFSCTRLAGLGGLEFSIKDIKLTGQKLCIQNSPNVKG